MTTDLRPRLAIALDVDDVDVAVDLVRRVSPWFGLAKVGLELWSAGGPTAVDRVRDAGAEVFLDVKLHDIPTTVGRAARVLGRLGLGYVTLHAAGGEAMLRSGVEGLAAGAAAAGAPVPCALGVTVLTSEPDTSAFADRLAAAVAAGCGGVVCAAAEVPEVHRVAPWLTAVVPGIRLAGDEAHDQARVATPGAAARAGADVLVVGRAVTGAASPEHAAARVERELREALADDSLAGSC